MMITLATLLAALLVIYIFAPALWRSLLVSDNTLDAYESGLTRVASRNPVRETGPPACMAKLIMLRHKMHQSNNRKRRMIPHSRQASWSYNVPPAIPNASRVRIGKQFGKHHH